MKIIFWFVYLVVAIGCTIATFYIPTSTYPVLNAEVAII